eukprot:796739-Rhodomonas_salina.2
MDNGGGGSRTAEMSSMQASKRRAAESGWENVPKGKHARYNDPYDGIGHVQWTLKQFQPEAPGSKVAPSCLRHVLCHARYGQGFFAPRLRSVFIADRRVEGSIAPWCRAFVKRCPLLR